MNRYQFIHEHADRLPVELMTRALGVSRSGFYQWRMRPASERQHRHEALAVEVRGVFEEHDAIYGSRKIASCLVERDVQVCRNTVAELMREMNLYSKV